MKPCGLHLLCYVALITVTACARPPQAAGDFRFTPASPSGAAAPGVLRRKIQHVVIIVQENRSFDNLFATFPGADGVTSGLIHTGETVQLKKAPLEDAHDITHQWQTFVKEYDGGKMDGFDLIHFGSGGGPPAGLFPYQYVDPAKIRPYWLLAQQYVLADHMFERQSSGSFLGHQYLIAAGTPIGPGASLVDTPNNMPWGMRRAGRYEDVADYEGRISSQ